MSKREFDFDNLRSLGREFSQKHQDFKVLAHLGNENARKQATLKFFFWMKEHKGVTLKQKLEKAIELIGEAEFLTLAKAWERMTVSLGDTTPSRKWKKSG